MAMYDAHPFSGGGFMSQQADQGLGGSGKGGRANKEQTLRAVSILQLVEAANAAGGDLDLVVDGAELSNVTLVGKVVSVGDATGKLDLRVSDGTGAVDVRVFVDGADTNPDAVAQKKAELGPGTYVRVYGHVRPMNGDRHVQAFAVRAVHDFNEITYHALQTIFQHMHNTKGAPAAAHAPAVKQELGGFGAPGAYAFGAQQQQPVVKREGSGAETCAEAVRRIISDPNAGENGVHVTEICTRLSGQGFSRQQVEAALVELQNNADAYTTVDDCTWRST